MFYCGWRGGVAIKGIWRGVVCVCVCLITRIICLIKNNKLSGKMKMFSFALWVNFNFLNFSKINCAKCSCKCKTNFHLFVRRTLPPATLLSLSPSLFLCCLPLLTLAFSVVAGFVTVSLKCISAICAQKA